MCSHVSETFTFYADVKVMKNYDEKKSSKRSRTKWTSQRKGNKKSITCSVRRLM